MVLSRAALGLYGLPGKAEDEVQVYHPAGDIPGRLKLLHNLK